MKMKATLVFLCALPALYLAVMLPFFGCPTKTFIYRMLLAFPYVANIPYLTFANFHFFKMAAQAPKFRKKCSENITTCLRNTIDMSYDGVQLQIMHFVCDETNECENSTSFVESCKSVTAETREDAAKQNNDSVIIDKAELCCDSSGTFILADLIP